MLRNPNIKPQNIRPHFKNNHPLPRPYREGETLPTTGVSQLRKQRKEFETNLKKELEALPRRTPLAHSPFAQRGRLLGRVARVPPRERDGLGCVACDTWPDAAMHCGYWTIDRIHLG